MKRLSFTLLMVTFIVAGCSALSQKTMEPPTGDPSPAADALFERLASRNSDLKTFKATGRIRLKSGEGVQRARAVWAGCGNQKIRMEILNPAGQPMVSFAYDGKRIYLISYSNGRFYSKRKSEASLQKLIAVPIKVNESLDLLSGRIPASVYRSVELLQEASDGIHILVLGKGERGYSHDRIYFDEKNDMIQKVESFDRDGNLSFRVVFEKIRQTDGFQIPIKLLISDGEDNSLHLDVDRYWPNASVSEALFVLSKPK